MWASKCPVLLVCGCIWDAHTTIHTNGKSAETNQYWCLTLDFAGLIQWPDLIHTCIFIFTYVCSECTIFFELHIFMMNMHKEALIKQYNYNNNACSVVMGLFLFQCRKYRPIFYVVYFYIISDAIIDSNFNLS